jgi:hypothetical protein
MRCWQCYHCDISTELDDTDWQLSVIGNFQEHTARAYLDHELQRRPQAAASSTPTSGTISDEDWSAVYKVMTT